MSPHDPAAATPQGWPAFRIRPEHPGDEAAIAAVARAAFLDHPHSQQTEVLVIDGLRCAGALVVSLVGEIHNEVVAYIAFSAITISGGASGWHGLGPLAVTPAAQNQGLGSALVSQGLRVLRERGSLGCVVMGEPSYHGRFGFRTNPALRLPGAPPGCFMVRPFARLVPLGEVSYHPAFQARVPG